MGEPTSSAYGFDVTPEDYEVFKAVVGRPAISEDEVALAKGTGLL